MRIEVIGTKRGPWLRFETGAIRRAREAVSPTPFSPPPVEPAEEARKEPNTRYHPSGKVSELHVAQTRNQRLLDIKV